MQKYTKHLTHYLPLIGVLVAGFLGFWYFAYDRGFQAAVIVATAVAYVAWGIIHHSLHKDLYLEVALEYILIAILATLAALSVILAA